MNMLSDEFMNELTKNLTSYDHNFGYSIGYRAFDFHTGSGYYFDRSLYGVKNRFLAYATRSSYFE